ncbi:MAG: NAD(+) diphosphatase [Lachnospiraceae bacterium]|nr:NAD(+) diphosphatase [Lachnospiraceae bacterium]
MIQDIAPHRYDNHYEEKKINENSLVMLFHHGKVLVNKTETALLYLSYKEVPVCVREKSFTYLFTIDEQDYFLGRVPEHSRQNRLADSQECREEYVPEGITKVYQWEAVSIFREKKYGFRAFAGITAYQLYQWYRDNRICSRCGSNLVHSHQERMMQCPDCGQAVYPRISPAVIVGITNGDQLLLTKYAAGDYKRYALVAGFTEIGETIEETVSREVMEEVGLKVKNIRYYKSQPWSFSGTLLMGFFAEVDGSTEIRMDENELAVAEWVKRDQVPHGEGEISLTREMMDIFYKST